MIQKDLFGNIENNEPQVIEVKSYTRKKKAIKKKVRTPSKVVSKSPINRESLTNQANKLIKYLIDNENATFMDAQRIYIGTPHSRFAEISQWMGRNKTVLNRKYITINGGGGDKIKCQQYWIDEVDKPTIKLLLGI